MLSDNVLDFFVWKRFKELILYHTFPISNDSKEERFGKHCGKGGNAGSRQFLFHPKCFQLYEREKSLF